MKAIGDTQRKSKGQQLKGKIVSALVHIFPQRWKGWRRPSGWPGGRHFVETRAGAGHPRRRRGRGAQGREAPGGCLQGGRGGGVPNNFLGGLKFPPR